MLRKEAVFTEGRKATQFPHVSYFYNAAFLKGLGIRYPIAKRGEDLRFINICTYFSKSTRCIETVLYNYWMNHTSTIHTDVVVSYLPELEKAYIQEKQTFSRLGVDYSNDREVLSMVVSLLPKLCAENSYKDTIAITSTNEYKLLRQSALQPWGHLQPAFRFWRSHPMLFYLKSQINPGLILKVKWLFQKAHSTRRLSDWIQYRLIEKWEKA